jgi:hypothetical protein
MPFDPLSWLCGFGLTQISKTIIGKLYTKDLYKKLYGVVNFWARHLPLELQIEPTTLFTENDSIEIGLVTNNFTKCGNNFR